jgi:hypothetical protein
MNDNIRPTRPEYAPIVEQVRAQLNARNLPRPPGLENERGGGTGYALQRHRCANGVAFTLMFRCGDGHNVHIGSFVVALANGPIRRERRARILQAGQTTDGKIITLASGRQVRVVIEKEGRYAGLPLPVPVELSR